jgi:hypothetical protein
VDIAGEPVELRDQQLRAGLPARFQRCAQLRALNLFIDNIFNQPAPIDWRGGWDLTAPQFRMIGAAASYAF